MQEGNKHITVDGMNLDLAAVLIAKNTTGTYIAEMHRIPKVK
jgi:hypothetical protein